MSFPNSYSDPCHYHRPSDHHRHHPQEDHRETVYSSYKLVPQRQIRCDRDPGGVYYSRYDPFREGHPRLKHFNMSPREHRRIDRTHFMVPDQRRPHDYTSAQDPRDFATYQHGYAISNGDGVSNTKAVSRYDRHVEDVGYGLSSGLCCAEQYSEHTNFQMHGQEFDVYSYRHKPRGDGIERVDHIVDLCKADLSRLGGFPVIISL